MKLTVCHRWDLPVHEAKAFQAQLAPKVLAETTFQSSDVRTVAGIDVGFAGGVATAAIVVLSFPDLTPVDSARADVAVTFPYVPGLLAFREAPGVLKALERLATWPDLLIFDAHGVAHPRRFGLAAHLGVILDCPSIGCAKSRLVGEHDEPGDEQGAWAPLRDAGAVIGAAVRTRAGLRPVYVSVGHRVDLPTAIEWVLRCTRGHRLPETTRSAHKLAGRAELAIRAGAPSSGEGLPSKAVSEASSGAATRPLAEPVGAGAARA